ncbi:MAG: hypothetical protein ABR913_01370 [Sedimentisphaerales bacterium]|jgi:hypothetical protein
MSISDQQIVAACSPVLESVAYHPENASERIFLNAYQIWLLLEQDNPDLCRELEHSYGTAKGKGGGHSVGPIQRIAQALGRCPNVETRYMCTKHIIVGEFEPSGDPDCGIFRLR